MALFLVNVQADLNCLFVNKGFCCANTLALNQFKVKGNVKVIVSNQTLDTILWNLVIAKPR